jgi:adenylate cyclase
VIYRLGPVTLDTDRLELRREGDACPVEPQVFALLTFLVENRDRVVGKDEIIDHVWGGRAISDSTLNARVSAARRLLGDTGQAQTAIRTFRKRGFRYVGDVAAEPSGERGDADAARGGPACAGEDPLAAMPPPPERPSIAILPFRNLGPDANSDYVADGIALGIQTILVQLSGLFLINACADPAYRAGAATAAQVLGGKPARYALEGAAQTEGQRVRVTAQLTDLRDDAVIWAARYDRELEDVFSLQDDLTYEIVTALSGQILGADVERVWTRSLSGGGAWEFFLRGVSHFYKSTRKDNAIARQMAARIFEIHPDKMMAPAYVALTHWVDAIQGWSDSRAESIRLAAEWAEKSVVSEDMNNGLGYVILGSVELLERRFDRALALVNKGVSYRVNCPFALAQLAAVQNYCGYPREAVKAARQALTVRMVYPPPLVNVLAMAYRDCGEIGLSIRAAREAAALDPDHADTYVTLCTAYEFGHHREEARAAARRVIEIDPAFTISEYAKRHPYRNPERMSQIAQLLRSIGLPD